MIFEIEVKDESAAKEFIQAYNTENSTDLDIVDKKGLNKLKLQTEKLNQLGVLKFAIAYGESSKFRTKVISASQKVMN